MTTTRPPLPNIFPAPGDRIRVPAPGGGWIRTFAGETRQDEAGVWVTKCAGEGWVPAGKVRKAASSTSANFPLAIPSEIE